MNYKENFLIKAQSVNPQFDYSKVEYKSRQDNITIICKIHGEFIRNAATLLRPTECPYCKKERLKQNFIAKAKKIHKDKYDYSKVNYISNKKPVEIVCKQHGSFFQCPGDHLKGNGCSKCSKTYKPTTSEWVDSVKDLYGGKYDFSKVEYKTNKTPVTVICPEHGEFHPLPNNFAKGKSGCPGCGKITLKKKLSKTQEQFITDAIAVHGTKYDYSKSIYINKLTKIKITCPEHGEFLQSPAVHLSGYGCSKCINKNQSKLFKIIKDAFPNEIIYYEKSPIWLGLQRFDIYIEKYNIAIEYDGEQHFRPISKFGDDVYRKTIIRDIKKERKCINNKCKLYRVKYGYSKFDLEKLIELITNDIKENKSYTKITKIGF